MKKVHTHHVALTLPSLTLEGGLFLPDQLEKAALGRAQWQGEADYGTPKGLKLQDDYSRAFQIACAQWKHFAAQLDRADVDAAALTQAFVQELLRDVFGYPAQVCRGIDLDGRHYPINLLAGSVPVVITPHTLALHQPDPCFAVTLPDGAITGARKKSAFMLAQEFLNASPEHLWGMACNGKTLRLLRDAATLTRPSFLEIDLADLLGGARYAEFTNVWRVLHASRAPMPASPATACIWEQWRVAGQAEGTRVRDGLRQGVTDALLILGEGFIQHPANDDLRSRLHNGALPQDAYFQQLLRLIYRLIFLFSVEERGLLHPKDHSPSALAARRAYAEGYALARLRDRCLKRRARNRFDDHWQGLRIVFKGLREGEPRLALPALGGLFAANQCPALDAASLDNTHLLAAMQNLRWASHQGLLAPVDYRNMGPEELGSVYESLLELVPEIDLPARRFGFVGLTSAGSTAGNARKTSGSYYTPDALVQALIRSALDPVIEQRLSEAGRMANGEWSDLPSSIKELFQNHVTESRPWQETPSTIRHSLLAIHAVSSIRVIDPACGSGHFLLAAARRLAEKLAELRATDGEQTEHNFRHALREVVSRCIFGVDRNPMAIELARTALWLEGFEEGQPLGFLDHHLQVGDALLGLTDLKVLERGIAKDAFKPLSGDDKEVCKALAKINATALKDLEKKQGSRQSPLRLHDETSLASLQALEALPENTTQEIAAKEAAYRAFLEQAKTSRLAHAADLLVGAFLLPKVENGEWRMANGEAGAANGDWQVANGGGAHSPLAIHHSPLIAIHHSPLTPPIPTSATLYLTLLGDTLPTEQQAALIAAQTICAEARVLHWPLAFPQVFAGGGFDCVLGNPPWERIKLQEEEFFATRHRDVAQAKNKAERSQRIQWLSEGMLAQHLFPQLAHPAHECAAEQRLYTEFIRARRTAEAASVFAHVPGDAGGRYPLTGVGDVNTYALFAETISQIVHAEGRAGFIVPTGIATDDSTKAYFAHQTQNGRLVSLYDIENREAVFPAVHRSYKFCLLTLGRATQAEFVCFASQASQLADPRRRFTLTPDEFRLINPNTLTCPVFRSERDAELTKKLYRAAPVLIEEGRSGGNSWGISFMAMLHMSNDSHLFADCPDAELLPLYEAKMIHQFDHRWATYGANGDWRMANGANGEWRMANGTADAPLAIHHSPLTTPPTSRDVTTQEKADPAYTVTPRYWVSAAEVEQRLSKYDREGNLIWHWPHRWLMGWRDICRATDERTVIASVVGRVATGDTLLLMFPDPKHGRKVACLLADQCSLVHDYVARQKIGGTHLKYHMKKQIVNLPPDSYTNADLAFIVPRVLELTYTAHDLQGWAEDLGYIGPPFTYHPERRAFLRAELDAWYAKRYGLTRDELRYILDPADVMGEDYPSETFRVLKNKEMREYGEYRTQRLVLTAWDQLETGDPA